MSNSQLFSGRVATNIVIANMIGTGIFTSIGFQVAPDAIPDSFTILMAWLIGGIVSLFGATAYAEVATTYRESGGEFTFLSKLYHPIVGLASGWVSMVVGFSAATATLALACGEYALPVAEALGFPFANKTTVNLIATLLIIMATAVQLRGVRLTSLVQNTATTLKILLIGLLIATPLILFSLGKISVPSFYPTKESANLIFSLPFAGALVWVMFAYSGWNASAYIVGHIRNPKKNLPKSLLGGTSVVTVLYMGLTISFLSVCSFEELRLTVDVGNLVLSKMLSNEFLILTSVAFTLALTSGINAMFIAGPTLIQKMGEKYETLSILKTKSKNGVPKNAVLVQAFLCILFILFSNFKDLVEYIGLTLTVFSVLTVAGVFVLRRRKKGDESMIVKTLGYPITPLVFIGIHIWIIAYFAYYDSVKTLCVFFTLIPALGIYYLEKKKTKKSKPNE